MRGNAARAFGLGLAVVGLVSVVAIAAGGTTQEGTDAVRPPSRTVLDTFFSLSLVAVVLGGALLLYGLAQRKAIAREVATGRYRRTTLIGYLLWIAAAGLIGYWLVAGRRAALQPAEERDPAFPDGELPPRPQDESGDAYTAQFTWVPVVVVAALIAAAIVAHYVSDRRAARSRPLEENLAEQLAAVLDDTLDDLRAEADPRRAVIAAYARLERVLAANRMPRQSSETPQELLHRVLRQLDLGSDAIERLTTLYARAKFSQHDVDVAMKEEAIGALEQVRDELREAAVPVDTTPGPQAAAVSGTAT